MLACPTDERLRAGSSWAAVPAGALTLTDVLVSNGDFDKGSQVLKEHHASSTVGFGVIVRPGIATLASPLSALPRCVHWTANTGSSWVENNSS